MGYLDNHWHLIANDNPHDLDAGSCYNSIRAKLRSGQQWIPTPPPTQEEIAADLAWKARQDRLLQMADDARNKQWRERFYKEV